MYPISISENVKIKHAEIAMYPKLESTTKLRMRKTVRTSLS